MSSNLMFSQLTDLFPQSNTSTIDDIAGYLSSEYQPQVKSPYYSESSDTIGKASGSPSYLLVSSPTTSTQERTDESDRHEKNYYDFCSSLDSEQPSDFYYPNAMNDEKPDDILLQSKKIHKESVQFKTYNDSRSKKDAWKSEEDNQLLALHAKFGAKWSKIAAEMPNRTGKQVRDRYLNALRPDINEGDWTEEEDKLFEVLHAKYGNKWAKIASNMPGRTENQVKNKFYWEKRKSSSTSIQKNSQNTSPNTSDSSEMSKIIAGLSAKPITPATQPSFKKIPESAKVIQNQSVDEFLSFETQNTSGSMDYVINDNFREVDWESF